MKATFSNPSISPGRAADSGALIPALLLVLLLLAVSFYVYIASAYPSANYGSPTLPDNSTTSYDWVFVNVTSSENLTMALLEWGNSSGFTNVSMLNNTLTNWYGNMTGLADGTYNYTVYVQNTTGTWNQSARRFVTVDAVPSVDYVSPTLPDNSTTNYNWVFVNITSSEGLALAYLEWSNSSGSNNITMMGASFNWFQNVTNLADGAHNYTVYVQNTTGTWNQSARRFVTVYTPLAITILSPSNTTHSQNWVWANITLNKPGSWCGVSLNGTANRTLSNASTTAWYLNLSVPAEGLNNATFHCNDTFGGMGSPQTGHFTIDTIPPYGLTSCQNLTIPGGYYALAQNVSSAGTCFAIGAGNVTLDGQGYTINYSKTQVGYALDDSLGYDNITIKNLVIANTSIPGASAIYGIGMSNSTIRNNTITTSSNNGRSVFLISSDANTISNNSITTSGGSGHSVSLNSSYSNVISDNNVRSGGDDGHSIYLDSSGSSTISNNTIVTSGRRGRGIWLNQSTSITITYNNITTVGVDFGDGIYAMASNSSTISNNVISTSTSYGRGMYLDLSNSSTISNNTISVSGSAGSIGCGLCLVASGSNAISNNTITAAGDSLRGIRLQSNSTSNLVSRNKIEASQNSAYGIALEGSSFNNFVNNTVTTSGTNGYAIYVVSAHSNNVTGGSIISRASNDYFLQAAGTANNFTDTNFTASRSIYFYDSDSVFNYNNQTSGSIWLKTNVSTATSLTRTLVNWGNALMRWNDTSGTAGITAVHNITGMLANVQYYVYVTAAGGQNVTYNLTTDPNGNLPGFAVAFNGNMEVMVVRSSLTAVVQSPLNTTYAQKWVWTNVSLNGAGSWCGVSLNGTANQTLSNASTTAWYLNLSVPAEGLNNATFHCNDTLGNMTSARTFFTIDTVQPLIAIQSPSNTTYGQKWVWANLTLGEQGSWCGASLNGAANQTMANSTGRWWLNLSVPAEGLNNATFSCNDTAGNANSSSAVFTIDTPPAMTILSPSNTTYAQKLVWTNISIDQPGSWCGVSLNGTANQTLTNSTGKWWLNLSVPADGQNNVTFYCNDTTGALGVSAARNFVIDTIPPSVAFAGQTPNNEMVNRSYAFINVTSPESLSAALLEWGGTGNQTMQGSGTGWYLNKTGLANGNYTFRVYANDTVNNWNSTEQRWVYINATNVTSYSYNFTLGNSTGGTISNATLRVYTDTGTDVLSYFRFNASTTSAGLNLSMGSKYHVKYALPAGVILDIKNITINASTTIDPRFVDSYADSLPASTTGRSYVIALNDSGLSYDRAELTLPITGTVNRILHCLGWNFTSATCSSWESNALSGYSYALNSTHLMFNVTSFDAYMAGYYEAQATPTSAPSYGGTGGGGGGGGSGGTRPAAVSGNRTVRAAATTGPFTSLQAIVDESFSNPEINVTPLLALPPEAAITPAGIPYAYAEITANFDTSKYLGQVQIGFAVNKSWYSNNGIDVSSTTLLRYTGRQYWQSLPTFLQGQDETAYSFYANTTAFSTFAIVGIKKPVSAQAPTATATPTQAPTGGVVVAAPSPTTPLAELPKTQSLLLLLLLFAVIVTLVFWGKRKPPIQPTLKEYLNEVKEEIHPPEDSNPKKPEDVEIG